MRPPRDRAGFGCAVHDPVVKVTLYGGRSDPFVRVVDTINRDGTVSREVLARGYIEAIDCKVSIK